MTTREIVPIMDFGLSDILCVVAPNKNAQELLQHVDLLEETVLKNLLTNFSTVDYQDPTLKEHVRAYEKVIVMGGKPLSKLIKGAKMADHEFTQRDKVFIVPAPSKLTTVRATKFFETKICPDTQNQ